MANINQITVDGNIYDIEDTTARQESGGKLPLSGGTMTGDINMASHKITGLVAPTSESEAVNKGYVDNLNGDFELIETITLDADVRTISRNKEPNGNAYNFKKIIGLCSFPTGGTGNCYVQFLPSGTAGQNLSLSYMRLNYNTCAFFIVADKSFYYTATASGLGQYAGIVQFGQIIDIENKIIDNFSVIGNADIKAGTVIKIYGVRA